MHKRIRAAILGATGSVGQRFVQLLTDHPWFDVVAVTGSERKVGQRFGGACHWVLPEGMPEWVKRLPSHQQLRQRAGCTAGILGSTFPLG